MTRTQDELVAKIGAVGREDYFGWSREMLIMYLDYEHARPFLKPDVEESDAWTPMPMHDEAIAAEAHAYLDFAWGKALDHRGISASRSVDKMRLYLWLLGHPQAAEFDEAEYAPYGAPQLAVAARLLGRGVPDDPTLTRMANGERCSPECTNCFG